MKKNPFVNAFAASGYIIGVVALLTYLTETQSMKSDTFLAPVLMLSLLTLSVTVMAFLFFYQPLMLYVEGKKKQALQLFAQTVGVFAGITAVVLLLVFSGVIQ